MLPLYGIKALLAALMLGQQANAYVAGAVEAAKSLEARGVINTNICLSSGVVTGTREGMQAQAKRLQDAPWKPNCDNIPDLKGKLQCKACQAAASTAWLGAIASCSEGSTLCEWGFPLCDAICIGIATYSYWSGCQACFCAHANCSDQAVRAAAGVTGAPSLTFGGGHFSLVGSGSVFTYVNTNTLHMAANPPQVRCGRPCTITSGCDRGGKGGG